MSTPHNSTRCTTSANPDDKASTIYTYPGQSRSNTRTDQYGGSIENRCRVVLEIADAVAGAVGADRTGIRLSPYGIANDSGEQEPMPLFSHLSADLANRRIAYLPLIQPRARGTARHMYSANRSSSAAQTMNVVWMATACRSA